MKGFKSGKRLYVALSIGAMAAIVIAAGPVLAAQLERVNVKEYGYQLKIPTQFKVQDKIGKTTNWIYQPGSVGGEVTKKKKFGIRIPIPRVGGIDLQNEESSSSAGGGLESALMIYVNYTHMPDVSAQVQYDANIKQTRQDAESPHPTYTDVQVFDKKKGYDWEGLAYWFKEIDKDKGDEIHRWHIKAFGNNAQYTIGLTGTYEQFKEWGPVYEEVVKSFELVPLEVK